MSETDMNQLRAEQKEKGKAEFFRRIDENILKMIANLSDIGTVKAKDLDSKKTALAVIDVVNGFVRDGSMQSSRIEDIVSPVINLIDIFTEAKMPVLAFADCHCKQSTELNHFPEHCLENTPEAELIDEIKSRGNYQLIKKNSVNGFFAPDFQKFLEENSEIDTFVVCGDCTDICIMNFCLTLRAYFDQNNRKIKIIVPIDAVETYDDNETHNGDLMNIIAIEMMANSGITIVNSVE